MDFTELLKNYAELAVRIGINIQNGQTLVINSPIECYEFTRMAANIAYEAGAGNVIVEWNDEEIGHIKLLKAPEEGLKRYPEWRAKGLETLAKEGAAFLSISASNPDLLKDVDPDRISVSNKVASMALREYRKYIMNSDVSWCVVSVPTKDWALKVFPHLSSEEAVKELWKNIFTIVRADKYDVVQAWNEHLDDLNKRVEFMNSNKFKKLYYKSSTADLTIELDKDHIWCGGGEHNLNKVYFVANIPTEEVFTVPLKTGINGKITSTKPLNYSGNLINNFTLTFKEGKIVDFSAEEGYEVLKNLIETDEGSHFLGEVALVPHHSPISDTGIIFYNTLFDENASCHLAIGRGYPSCLEGGTKMDEDELEAKGVNNSLTHVDFMVGGPDLDIVGETWDGKKLQIFKDGNWGF